VANRLNFNTSQFDQVKDNRIKQWRDQEYTYDAWGNLVEKRVGLGKLQTFTYDCENRLVRAETMVNSQVHSVGSYRLTVWVAELGREDDLILLSEMEMRRALQKNNRSDRSESRSA
jgi:YD repeat-containing protein